MHETLSSPTSNSIGASWQNSTPDSPQSHSSSAYAEDFHSAHFPVPCFQPKPAKQDQPKQGKKPASSGFAPCGPAPNFRPEQVTTPGAHIAGSKTCCTSKNISGALCEAGIVDVPQRSFSGAGALSSSTAFRGESKENGSESENSDELSPSSRHASSPKNALEDFEVAKEVPAVSFQESLNKWRAEINGEASYYGSKAEAEQAYRHSILQAEYQAEQAFDARDEDVMHTSFTPVISCKGEVAVKEEPGAFERELERMGSARRKQSSRQRTSKFMGVGSSNRKNQWQARILVQGKVTHLGYYETEEEAARVYDRVAISFNPKAHTNFEATQYERQGASKLKGLDRTELQRALGVKPMDKSSQFRGVSKKKGKWEAKVMVNRKWAYRALFDSEVEAARAYDVAVWRLKPREAVSFVNFKDGSSRLNKRCSRSFSSLARTKSQRTDLESSAGSLLPMWSAPFTEEHSFKEKLQAVHELEGPETPTRRHSVQLPLSQPLKSHMQKSPAVESMGSLDTVVSMPLQHNEKVAQLQQEDLMQIPAPASQGQLLPEIDTHPAGFSRRPSYPQLQPSLSGVPLVALPDPNSIGVPPPDNLPYPELVSAALPSPVAANSNTGSGMISMGNVVPAPALSLPLPITNTPALTACSSGIPDIPQPLLSTVDMALPLASQASSRVDLNYYDNTPLSEGLGQALAANITQQQEPQQQQLPNPFLEASNVLPPISSQPSGMLVRVGSEAHLVSEQPANMQKLNSTTPSLDVFPNKQSSMPISRLSSVNSAALHRVASESVLRNQGLSPNLGPSLGHMPGIQVDQYGRQDSGLTVSGEILHQHSLTSSNLGQHSGIIHTQASLNSNTPLGPSATYSRTSTQMPEVVFEECFPEMPGHFNPGGEVPTPMDASVTYSDNMRSCQATGMDFMPGIMREDARMNRSMSASSLAPATYAVGRCSSMPQSTSTAQIYGMLHHTTSLDSSPVALRSLGLPPFLGMTGQEATISNQQIAPIQPSEPMDPLAIRSSDAEDLIAAFGMDVNMAELTPPVNTVQIGGEELHRFSSKEINRGPFLLGGDQA